MKGASWTILPPTFPPPLADRRRIPSRGKSHEISMISRRPSGLGSSWVRGVSGTLSRAYEHSHERDVSDCDTDASVRAGA
jgi:hypothetical protein